MPSAMLWAGAYSTWHKELQKEEEKGEEEELVGHIDSSLVK